MHGLHPVPSEYSDRSMMSPPNFIVSSDYQSVMANSAFHRMPAPELLTYGSDEFISVASAISEATSIGHEMRRDDDVSITLKAKIASHPRYHSLLQAYIDCQKVGAPQYISGLLDEIVRQIDKENIASSFIGADPELDDFMEAYCNILGKYKSDLSRPFNEATSFLNRMESQLSSLCTGTCVKTASNDGAISSDDEYSIGEAEIQNTHNKDEESDLKDKLLRRFGSHIGSLKMEFSKKKKGGKLPREARKALLEWWNAHCKWPYPTEADKICLAEMTGLDPRQINNWFINQRKRHWKPSENMQFALMDNLSGQFFADE
ncbi:hypothetical protein V2J09_013107 [Rumex salicifolius]